MPTPRLVPIILTTAFALSLLGCIAAEAFPTVIDNRSDQTIYVRYLASGHEDWSALWRIPPGEAESLARDDWVQNIIAIQISEGNRIYRFAKPDMQRLRKHCDASFMGRVFKLSPDCYMRYFGSGHWTANLGVPTKVQMRLNRSLQATS
jgi:hypothetical protein